MERRGRASGGSEAVGGTSCGRWIGLVVGVALLAFATPGFARIKLTTLPTRERVEIQLDNRDATLVEEERIVTLLQGSNDIDFSWTNTAIDKGTIQFRVVDMPTRAKKADDPAPIVRPDGQVETIRVITAAYPPGENALVWEVYSEKPVAARVRISYLIGNLGKSFNYRAVAENDESALTLRKYLRLDNFSGEEFGSSGIWAGFGTYFHREVGLNEAKELLIWKYEGVPVTKTFTFNWWTGQPVPNEPDQRYVKMRYLLTNDKKHKMGEFPLQPGKVRIFQKDSRGTEAFLGEDWGGFTPIDDEMKLHLGLARDVVVKRTVEKSERQKVDGNLFHQDIVLKYSIENFKTSPLTLDVVEDMVQLRNAFCGAKDRPVEWEVLREGTTLSEKQTERKEAQTLELHVPLEAAPKGEAKVTPVVATVHLVIRNEW